MNNSNKESQELLRLFKCTVETGTEVLSAFADRKLSQPYGGSFKRFLDDKKHQMFHMWESKKLLCCACPPAGCSFKRTGQMYNWIFKKIYDESGPEDKGHIVRNRGRIVQLCLHKYMTRNIAIHELDIIAMSFLLRNFAHLSNKETSALDTVTTYRNEICHAQSMNCYTITEVNTVWNELENALVDLADPSYKRLIRIQIKDLQKVYLEKEEISKLLQRVEEVKVSIDEVKNVLSTTNNAIEKCEGNLKRTFVEESQVLQQCISNEAGEMKQAQQIVLQEVTSSKAEAKGSADNILEHIAILNTNQTSNNLEMNEKMNTIVEILYQMKSTTFSIKHEEPKDLFKDSDECFVLWQLETPEHWNAEEVEKILTKSDRFKDLPLKIKFVRKGSLVIITTVSAKELKDSTTFQSAVKAFLTKMVEVCNIDTSVLCNVGVTLHILESDELNVTYSLPNITTDDKAVQTEDTSYELQTRNKTHLIESMKFDVAF